MSAVPLDPERQKRAAERARAADKTAEYHEEQARVERAKATSIARTWNLCPVTFTPLES